MTINRTRLAAGSALTAATLLVLTSAPAWAHVTIDPAEAPAGGYTTLNVKVPNERDNASTVQLELHLDPEHPVPSVMPQPVPGWDVEVTTAELDEPVEIHGSEVTEAPSVITWTGGEINPGTFQQFPLSVGPLPHGTDRLVFDAIQTYDNDEVVRWIEEPVDGEAEPDYPAAVLRLAEGEGGHGAPAEGASDDAAGGDADAAHAEGEPVAAEDGDSGGSDMLARVLAVGGIVVGAAGVALGVLAGRRPNGPAAG
ncbi:YcnI family copper-binding membrane protein [Streptomyces marincola]|uniref:YcnI family copper-binding membrane protein n=1 Tax=Streptomyces marincola TaxID=2878388 RepID=UPI001CF1B434|nr:YcnI family protein [Streptomyces marincola]UCM89169.1 YcnI family protein [Streptomyces marincola]